MTILLGSAASKLTLDTSSFAKSINKRDEVEQSCSCQQDAERIRALMDSLERHTIGVRKALDGLCEITERWKEAA